MCNGRTPMEQKKMCPNKLSKSRRVVSTEKNGLNDNGAKESEICHWNLMKHHARRSAKQIPVDSERRRARRQSHSQSNLIPIDKHEVNLINLNSIESNKRDSKHISSESSSLVRCCCRGCSKSKIGCKLYPDVISEMFQLHVALVSEPLLLLLCL